MIPLAGATAVWLLNDIHHLDDIHHRGRRSSRHDSGPARLFPRTMVGLGIRSRKDGSDWLMLGRRQCLCRRISSSDHTV
jgi:hypothetical protein